MFLGIDIGKCSKTTIKMGVVMGVALGVSTDVAMGAARDRPIIGIPIIGIG